MGTHIFLGFLYTQQLNGSQNKFLKKAQIFVRRNYLDNPYCLRDSLFNLIKLYIGTKPNISEIAESQLFRSSLYCITENLGRIVELAQQRFSQYPFYEFFFVASLLKAAYYSI